MYSKLVQSSKWKFELIFFIVLKKLKKLTGLNKVLPVLGRRTAGQIKRKHLFDTAFWLAIFSRMSTILCLNVLLLESLNLTPIILWLHNNKTCDLLHLLSTYLRFSLYKFMLTLNLSSSSENSLIRSVIAFVKASWGLYSGVVCTRKTNLCSRGWGFLYAANNTWGSFHNCLKVK